MRKIDWVNIVRLFVLIIGCLSLPVFGWLSAWLCFHNLAQWLAPVVFMASCIAYSLLFTLAWFFLTGYWSKE